MARRGKTRAATAAGAALATLVPGIASAQQPPATTVAIGVLTGGAWSGSLVNTAFGAEISLMHFPRGTELGFGGWLHLQAYFSEYQPARYVATGLQVAYYGLGVELGIASHEGVGPFGTATDVHFGLFGSAGVIALLVGLDVPVASDYGLLSYGPEFTLGLALKFPAGNYPARMNFSQGRPLRVEGRVALPAVEPVARARKRRSVRAKNAVDAPLRRALGLAWLHDAREEHASVAAFATLSLRLMALGAPPALIARCHHAALEELAHAAECFALAGEYLGERFEAGGLPEAASAPDATTPVALAWESFVDGCVGEGASAGVLALASREAHDPGLRRTLARIAREEAAHAELAWDVFAFCLEKCSKEQRDDLRSRAGRLAREPSSRARRAEREHPAGHGRLRDSQSLRVLREMRRECARRAEALLATPVATATAATRPRASRSRRTAARSS